MSKYRVGQKVKVEFLDEDVTVVTGWLSKSTDPYNPGPALHVPGCNGYICPEISDRAKDRTITILEEPRMDEPGELGAMVEAHLQGYEPSTYIRYRLTPRTLGENWAGDWMQAGTGISTRWSDLIDPRTVTK